MPVKITPSGGMQPIAAALSREIVRATRESVSYAERRVKLRYSGPTGTARLSVRTGYLRDRGVKREVRGGPPPVLISGRVYVEPGKPPYAEIHETGGTIRPKSGKYLTIPIPGGPAYPRSRASARPVRARDFPGAFVIRSKKGNLLLVRAKTFRSGARRGQRIRGQRGGLELLFLLKSSVRIPRRPVWETTAVEVRPWIENRFRQAIDTAVAIVRRGGG